MNYHIIWIFALGLPIVSILSAWIFHYVTCALAINSWDYKEVKKEMKRIDDGF